MTRRRGLTVKPWPPEKLARARKAIQDGVQLSWVAERFGVSPEVLRWTLRACPPSPDKP